jgi:GNAT superfamily N-acetyltransferase
VVPILDVGISKDYILKNRYFKMEFVKAKREDFEKFFILEKEFRTYNKRLNIDKQYRPINWKEKDYKKYYLDLLKKEKSFFMFIIMGEEYAGYIYGYISESPSVFLIRKVGHLDSLFVRKKFRGKKASTRLKKEFFNWLKSKKVKLCEIHVASSNKETIRIYEQWGFKTDDLRMHKKIT